MRKLYWFLFTFFIQSHIFSQNIITKDPQIEKMVNEVSPDSLRSSITKLVGFGTRNTLSTQSDPKRGIGAARQWVLSRFIKFGKESGGKLTAVIDTTIYKKDGRRVDRDIVLGNVVAR